MANRTTFIETVTILNIIVFLYTGISKIMDYSVFKQQLADSPILGFASKPVAILLPAVEITVVILLAIPRWRLTGLFSSLALMIAFTAYIIAMFIVSPEMPCSCGGIIALLSWKQHLVFNSAFILLNALAIRLQKRGKKEQAKAWNEASTYLASHI